MIGDLVDRLPIHYMLAKSVVHKTHVVYGPSVTITRYNIAECAKYYTRRLFYLDLNLYEDFE